MEKAVIIGAGLAGMSAALSLAEKKIPCVLISLQPSERAQSVLAEGGINGACNTMGEADSPAEHAADTLRSGVGLCNPEAVRRLSEDAPGIIESLRKLGVPFHTVGGVLQQRNFGGQKKKRTAYAASSTGKVITHALIDAVRKAEAEGLVTRLCHHEFLQLSLSPDDVCLGAWVKDVRSGAISLHTGPVLLAFGGLNGLFAGHTTGTAANSGDGAAAVFAQGVRFGSLEMVQYHPTTIGIAGKRCLISEAARGEGGRLFVMRGGKPWYFMEELYPELGNLMPRDVVSREMVFAMERPDCEKQIYLDLRGISAEIWQKKLPDLREEILHYLSLDPAKEPVPVEPGIHYFMGGVAVDPDHRTNIKRLFAAGECCNAYHGANRLGGNSMLGAIRGGRTAAEGLVEILKAGEAVSQGAETAAVPPADPGVLRPGFAGQVTAALQTGMGIVRREADLLRTIEALEERRGLPDLNRREENRLNLALAMAKSALARKESRGAHFRVDYPEKDEAYLAVMTAQWKDNALTLSRQPVEGVAR